MYKNLKRLWKHISLVGILALSIASLASARAESYQDGKYLGIARDGPFLVKVNVIIDEGRIKDIEYLEIPDWQNEVVKSLMRQRIVKQQSSAVDSLTGATTSSNLIKAAVRDGLSRAIVSPTTAPVLPSPASDNDPRVILQTNRGEIELRLFTDKAPLAAKNFLTLVERGYYDGTIFHRVIQNFMIQGGDPTGTGRGGEAAAGKPFPDEFSPDLKFDRVGLLAMANRGPGTNSSQFFITVVKTPWLNGLHTIFGEVVSGFEVVEAISRVPTEERSNRPIVKQEIIKARLK